MSKKIIAANWKMNPQTWAEAEQLLDGISDYIANAGGENESSIIVCPPFVFLEEVGKVLSTTSLGQYVALGAQDIAIDDSGAMTGEVSGPMLNKLGVQYVIVGHSERRWKLGESDEVVNQKLKAVIRNELIPIVCIGEKVRDDNFKDFLKNQMSSTFAGLNRDEMEKCIVAYEPVWAISSNPGAHPDTPESALESISVLKQILNTVYLYGGSVNSANANSFLAEDEINGVLVGGASVNKEEFAKILSIVKELK